MADKTIAAIYRQLVQEDAGTRDANGVDRRTCFGIPGSGLPRRHCNVDMYVNVIVCDDLSVYLSISDGHIFQNVFGTTYSCRMYASPRPFKMQIPYGSKGWSDIKFIDNNEKDCSKDVSGIVTSGSLSKTYENNIPFDWVFGPTTTVEVGKTYSEKTITASKTTRKSHNGGESVSDSHYVSMGKLTDYGWVEELQDTSDGYIYLCGGIVYPNATVDSDIEAVSVAIKITGINTWFWYYPGDILVGGKRMSLNRGGGHFYMKTDKSAKFMMQHHENGITWRDCKNCPKDGDNWDHKVRILNEGEWVKAELTGKE